MKCALVVDIRGWAFDRIAQGIVKYNPDPELEIDIFYANNLRGRRIFDKYDVLYAFSPYQAGVFLSRGYRDFITTIHMNPLRPKLSPGNIPRASSYGMERWRAIIGAKRVSVLNNMQLKMMREIRPGTVKLDVGFDPEIFHPKRKLLCEHGFLRVGWVGNPEKLFKRFDLVKIACAIEGVELCAVTRVPEEELLSQEEMSAFYHSLDVYLCLSDHEGLPTPSIEAAACGIPIISTLVGILSELIENGVNGYLVAQDAGEIQERLCCLRNDRSVCRAMGSAMLERVKGRAWPEVVNQWVGFIKGKYEY